MASNNRNKPPLLGNKITKASFSSNKNKCGGNEVTCDKEQKFGAKKMVGTENYGRIRQAFSVVNGIQDLGLNSNPASNTGSDYGSLEFTRQDVEALLSEKMRYKGKFNYKERCESMMDYIKRLRLCIKWFQQLEGDYAFEHERSRSVSELTDKKCVEMELTLKNKEEELNLMIVELRKSFATLQEKLAKEESDKLAVVDSLAREKETRINIERSHASLSKELGKAQEELQSANQRIASVNDMYKLLQEYNSSLQHYNTKHQKDIDAVHESIRRGEKEKYALVENLSTLRGQYKSLQEQLSSCRASQGEAMKQKDALVHEVACLRVELQQVRDDRDHQLSQVQAYQDEAMKQKDALVHEVTCLRVELQEVRDDYDRQLSQVQPLTDDIFRYKELAVSSEELQARCTSQSNQIRSLSDHLAAAEKKLQMSDLSVLESRTEFEEQKQLINELRSCLADAEYKLIEGEKLRKKLHNTILELKGNIRILCRVRHLLPDDNSSSEGKMIAYPTSTEALGRGIDIMQNGKKHSFSFDRVFMPDESQEDIFVELSQLVQSALDGYKVCIFVYGQTGSGTTYTMMGKPGHPDLKGLIPRSLEQIFQTRQSLLSQGWKYEMQVSMLEIYNETIRDLLSTNRDASRLENTANGKQYAIKHDANGNTHVTDLTVVDVCSTKEVSYLLYLAAHRRSVGKTQMNEQSSRSHFVFTLRISGVNDSTEQQVQGVLNLVDLAGSEHLSMSGSNGDRLKETQAINKSLSSLSDVIFSLAKEEDRIPFRNSKLTYLLQPGLGGDSKALMFVNISPEPSSVSESLRSLRFAARVNACEIGTRRQTNMRSLESRF